MISTFSFFPNCSTVQYTTHLRKPNSTRAAIRLNYADRELYHKLKCLHSQNSSVLTILTKKYMYVGRYTLEKKSTSGFAGVVKFCINWREWERFSESSVSKTLWEHMSLAAVYFHDQPPPHRANASTSFLLSSLWGSALLLTKVIS